MLSSEKRSLIRFLVIYLTSTFLLFSLASGIFYLATKEHLLDKQKESLKYEAESIISSLRKLHHAHVDPIIYPDRITVDSAIYDSEKRYIFGTFDTEVPLKEQDNDLYLYSISKVEPYYLGAAYILLSKEIDFVPIKKLKVELLLFMMVAGIFFSVLGYFLGKLFVEPMRESIEQMNLFIQDTTHELNTPISTILTNIEMIETLGKYKENKDELQRIEIASKTLSRIYDDLTYLNLNHKYYRKIVAVDISVLLKERIVYFRSMIDLKDITLHESIDENIILMIDKNDALRLIDNLISNAIKYNKQGGTLDITLTKYSFVVRDTGIGISKDDLGKILQRFKRVNKSDGGFGIGLDIVSQVVESYDYGLHINSLIDKETKVSVVWEK